MRRIVLSFLLLASITFLAVGAAAAQTDGPILTRAAEALRRDPVYVDSAAERAIDTGPAHQLRRQVRERGVPILIAVLPAAAAGEAGGDVNAVPEALARRVGLTGTYGVVAGNSFRAFSTSVPQARDLATATFQARSSEGTAAVLEEFVNRVAAAAGQSNSNTNQPPFGGEESGDSDSGGGSSVLPILLVVGAAGGGFYLWRRSKKKRAEVKAQREEERSMLQAELGVLAQDVVNLEPEVSLHPDARADFDAAVARFRVAQAALDQGDARIDLERVRRVIAEGQYAMSRAKAILDGREPPPPPADLARPGRHQEPALELDEQRQPQYVGGYGTPFYGGGWFGGGGGGLLTGLFLGSMLGGGWGYGGGHQEQNIYVEGSGDGAGDGAGAGDGGGGGDWGGDGGGGDWGGGDFGGGDFGGGDFGGGGDW